MKKSPLPLLALVAATAAGLGAGQYLKPMLAGGGRGGSAGQATAAPGKSLSEEELALAIKADLATAGPANSGGPALAERLRGAFQLLGVDEFWTDALAATSAAGFPDLMAKLGALPPGRRQLIETMLLDRWAQLDPQGGAEYFKKLADTKPGDPLGDDALANFIRQWGMIDFAAAATKAGEFGEKTTRRTLREKAKLDPAGFLAWAKDHPGTNPFSILTSNNPDNAVALGRLADLDLDRVLAWSKDVPIEKWRTQLAPVLAEKLARRNPDEAIAWAKDLKDPAATQSALAGVATALAETDPTRALSVLKELGSGGGLDFQLMQTYQKVITKLGLDDPTRALAVLDDLPKGQLRSQIIGQALSQLLKSDPAKAFAMGEKLGAEVGMGGMGPNESMIPKSPDAAREMLDLASKAGDSSFRQQVAMMSLMGWLQADQHSLGEYLKGNLEQPMFKDVKQFLGPGLAAMMLQSGKEVDPALADAVGMKPEMRLSAMADRNPAGAADGLESVSDPAARSTLITAITQKWSNQDRPDALDWAATLKDPAEQAAAYKSLAGNWMDEDSHRASAWIGSLPSGQARDAAVSSMVTSVAQSDPDLSWQWSLTMTDPAQRAEALGQSARAWQTKDANAIGEALKNPALSEADRASIAIALQK